LTAWLVYLEKLYDLRKGVEENWRYGLLRTFGAVGSTREKRAAILQEQERDLEQKLAEFDESRRLYTFAVMNSSADQIKAALKKCPPEIFKYHRQAGYAQSKAEKITRMLEFALDCPLEHEIHLPGLIDKSIEYHQHRIEIEAEKKREIARLCKLPVLRELPPDPRVKYVQEAERFIDLGNELYNCLAQYIQDRAVQGISFIFEIDYEGEKAAVEVRRTSEGPRIEQAHGPDNRPNKASAWGATYLGAWIQKHFEMVRPGEVPSPWVGQPAVECFEDDIPF
jgi:hypothetical protein